MAEVDYKFQRCDRDENGNFKLTTIKPLEDIFKDLENYNKYLEDVIVDLRKEVKKLKNFNKDEEIEKLKKEIEDLEEQSVYVLTKSQKEKMEKFRHEHYKMTGHNYYQVVLRPNEIFTKVVIQCDKCDEELDLTIY